MLFATAEAAEHSARQPSQAADGFASLIAAIATADAARYPHVARLGAELLSGDGDARIDWALDVLLAGVLATPRTPPDGARP